MMCTRLSGPGGGLRSALDSTRSPGLAPSDPDQPGCPNNIDDMAIQELLISNEVGDRLQDSTRSPGETPPQILAHVYQHHEPGTNQNNLWTWKQIVNLPSRGSQGAEENQSTTKLPPEHIILPEKISYKKVGYTLDKTKALKKKLEASERLYTYTILKADKANISISCQAGLYELFRRAICIYFAYMESDEIDVAVEIHQDREKNIVQSNFRVRNGEKDSKGGYTVSLYHTTSSILVNGKNFSRFLDHDWQEIAIIIHEINQLNEFTDIDVLNRTIQECLNELLKRNKGTKTKNDKKDNKHRDTLKELLTSCTNENSKGLQLQLQYRPGTPITQGTPTNQELQAKAVCTYTGEDKQNPGEVDQPTPYLPLSTDETPKEELGKLAQGDSTPTEIVPQATSVSNSLGQRVMSECNGARVKRDAITADSLLQNQTTTVTTTETPHHQNTQQNEEITAQQNKVDELPRQENTTAGENPHANKHTSNSHSPSAAVNNYNCENCRILRADWHRALQEIQTREKRMTTAERNLKSKEKELERQLSQLESQKALIMNLEAKVADLTASNRLLQQAMDSSNGHQQNHGMQPNYNYHPPNQGHYSQTQDQNQVLKEEIRTLKDEIRMKDMEQRMMERMNNMEKTLLTSYFSNQQQSQPTVWSPPPVPHFNHGWLPPHLYTTFTPTRMQPGTHRQAPNPVQPESQPQARPTTRESSTYNPQHKTSQNSGREPHNPSQGEQARQQSHHNRINRDTWKQDRISRNWRDRPNGTSDHIYKKQNNNQVAESGNTVIHQARGNPPTVIRPGSDQTSKHQVDVSDQE